MTPETLDRAIDAILAGDLATSPSGEAKAAASLVAMASHVPPSPGRAGVRRAVLTAAAPRRPWLRRGMVLAPVAASLAFSGIAVAARTALPGDPLYQVRRGLQAVRVAVAIGDQSKAVALLDRAERDVADAERALAQSRESDARNALRVFAADIATARSEIARLDADAAVPLTRRADALQERADRAAARTDDDGSPDSDDDSGSDDSNSGPGSDDSGSDDSGSDDSNSGPGSDESGSDDSGSDDSNSASGSDDSGSSSGSDDESSSGSSSDDSASTSGSGSSGSGSDDDSTSGSDDASSSGSGSDD